ncbi:hypothetical protein GMJAKD_01540 [Candidatus Electrothrix aarhusensis]
MKKFHKAVDIVWPILRGTPEQPRIISFSDVEIGDSDIDATLELVLKISDSETERRANIETKSLVFITSTSIVAMITWQTSKSLMESNLPVNFFTFLAHFIVLLVVIYLSKTIYHSIEALKSRSYQNIGFKDVILNCKNTKRELILTIINKTRANYNVINAKVDNMSLAQGFFQRSLFLFCIHALLIFSQKFFVGRYIFSSDVYTPHSNLIFFFEVILVFFILKLIVVFLVMLFMKKKFQE